MSKDLVVKDITFRNLNLAELKNFQDDIKIINKEDLEKLKKSIIKYNFQFPFLAYQKNNSSFLIDGHQRLKALESLRADGYNIPQQFPVVFIPFSTDKEAKQAVLLFNASYGDFYEKNLKKFVRTIDDKNFLENIPLPLDKFVVELQSSFDTKFKKFQNLSFANVSFEEMNKEMAEKIKNNGFYKNAMLEEEFLKSEEKDKEEESFSLTSELYKNVAEVSKFGDVFELGGHLLMHVSSTDESLINSIFKKYRIKIILTDPPYGISYNPKLKTKKEDILKADTIYGGRGAIVGDEDTSVFKDFWKLVQGFEKDLLVILFGGNYFSDILLPTNAWGIWDKMQSFENRSDAELFWTNSSYNTKIFRHKYNGVVKENVDNEERVGNTYLGRIHPTQKPYTLLKKIIKFYNKEELKENEYLLDAFAGSGSTLIACEELGMKSINIEFDSFFVDRIILRYYIFSKILGRVPHFRKNNVDFNYEAILKDNNIDIDKLILK